MSTPTEAKYKCADCDSEVDGDECYSKEDGSIYCQRCYYENQAFRCSVCEEHEEQEHQHNVLVVFDPEETFDRVGRGARAGLYQIIGRPYWRDGMIESAVYFDRVKFVRALPKEAVMGCYPAGHLCRPCIKKYVPQCRRPKI